MKQGVQAARQPGQGEVHALFNLYNTGQLNAAEARARALLKQYPGALVVYNVLGVALEGQGKLQDAVQCYRKALAINPSISEMHFNLGSVLSQLGHDDEAVTSYRRAIQISPGLAVAHFNLGALLQKKQSIDEAIKHYRQAVVIEPGFFEAYGAMGTALQQQGHLDDAIACYRQSLAISDHAQGHFNLATALRDRGGLEQAISHYRQAIALQPNYADAHNNLGEVFRDQGNMENAVTCYLQALRMKPGHRAASFNMAQFLYDAGRFIEAIPYFEDSQQEDWQERILYCLYKSEQYEIFRRRLLPMLAAREHVSPFLATLSTHYATNFHTEDAYRFCKQPMDFIFHRSIKPLAEPGSALLSQLLDDIQLTEIAERKQGRLHHGMQSAGNLFKRKEDSFCELADLIRAEVSAYAQAFQGRDCDLMRHFPEQVEFASSWYVRMRQGGHLTSHIHEIGWLSGCVYLALPRQVEGRDDGCIEFSTHGDDYPKLHDDFPVKTIRPSVGDIVLFPSSLFHRTVPFHSDEERICIAFDIKPSARFSQGMLSFNSMKVMALAAFNLIVAEIAEISAWSLRVFV
ncbi:tetratricopeptide repeat protein [Methylobacillus flagellatus]|uniref:tetratricopeptide repeat protein n=1 Tax=Methylobacillus flagellatus TaxID=405 RepID=UPI002853E29F|nr:tetratricopeptide repeat protein [Methylobacillus flagellatus]MDR5171204.1 tetratricopeptide repeat protein [Methylobacillus flagellatus]